jgi:ferredoxin
MLPVRYSSAGRLSGEYSMKVFIDSDLCMGCGVCESIASKLFKIEEDGVARVVLGEVPPQFEAAVRQAIEECPEEAISFE